MGNKFYTANWPSDFERLGAVTCALLNTEGGLIVIGMTDERHPVGIDAADARIADLSAFFRANISPIPCVMIQAQVVKEKTVLRIDVPAGINRPYLYHGRAYVVEGGRVGYASSSSVRSMVLRADAEVVRWEERFSLASIERDIDEESVKKGFDRVARLVSGADKAQTLSDMLSCYGVFRDWRLTNAGDVLFCRNPDIRSPQVRIRAFCYRSDKSGDGFLDSKLIAGPLVSAISEAELFIARNTHAPQNFTASKFVRDSGTTYPPAVIREALVNAVAHRDYSSVSGGVAIHIYPNRLEIWNSGDLPDGVSVDALGRDQVSVLRNPTIAYALYLQGYMEQAGRGSVLMCRQCEEIGLRRPEWKARKGEGVTIVFYRIIQSDQTDTIDGLVFDTIRKYPGIKRDRLAKIVGFSVPTVSRAIKNLKTKGVVVRQGGLRYGGYFERTV